MILRKLRKAEGFYNIMYVPVLLLIGFFIVYPFLRGIFISFTDWNGYSQNFNIVGFAKYKLMFTDRNIVVTIQNTLLYGFISTLFQNILGLSLALLLGSKIKGKTIARTFVYLPVIISPLIIGYIWKFLFQYDGGAINDVLIFLGMDAVDWLAQRSRAVAIIIIVNVYQFTGSAMIIYLAGLKSIPQSYYEAISLDTTSSWTNFRVITLPMLMPAITINFVLNIIGGLKLFDVIIALTKGGPGYATQSLSTMMYNLYFAQQDAGYAAALGNFMFLLVCVIGLFTLKFFRSREVDL